MRHYIDLIKEQDEFCYISYSNEEIVESIEGGAFYLDFVLQDGKLQFVDIFHNVSTTKPAPLFLLDYIKAIEGKELDSVQTETLNFFSGEKVIYNEQAN